MTRWQKSSDCPDAIFTFSTTTCSGVRGSPRPCSMACAAWDASGRRRAPCGGSRLPPPRRLPAGRHGRSDAGVRLLEGLRGLLSLEINLGGSLDQGDPSRANAAHGLFGGLEEI